MSITLIDHNFTLTDVRIPEAPNLASNYNRIPQSLDPRQIPLYLLQAPPLPVYTELSDTETYFRTNLNYDSSILFAHDDKLLLFYYDSAVRALIIDFTAISALVTCALAAQETFNAFVSVPAKLASNVSVFDKVLSDKRRPRAAAPTRANAPDGGQVLGKLIMSGLRLRGMSMDRVETREVYHMTYKSAQFAIRKFRGRGGDIQEVVEKLLQVYVDV